MTEEMLGRSRAAATAMGLHNVEFRQGEIEALPIEDGWADVAISNGVINLCAETCAPISAGSSPRSRGWSGRADVGSLPASRTARRLRRGALRTIDLWTD
jgi:arsenite methyltransferase